MLNPKEEAKFAELKDKCRELKVPAPPEIFIGLQVHDKNGVLVFDDKQRGHSWTRNFYNVLVAVAGHPTLGADSTFGAGHMNLKASAGTVSATQLNWPNGAIQSTYPGAISSTAYGIVVGTGDTAFSVEQYTLAALIAGGTGAGQFSYQAGAATAAYAAGPKTWTATQTRVMNNNSGGSITVKEVGIIGYNLTWADVSLWERSVLDPTVAVANGAQLTVTYEISMDFSAID